MDTVGIIPIFLLLGATVIGIVGCADGGDGGGGCLTFAGKTEKKKGD